MGPPPVELLEFDPVDALPVDPVDMLEPVDEVKLLDDVAVVEPDCVLEEDWVLDAVAPPVPPVVFDVHAADESAIASEKTALRIARD